MDILSSLPFFSYIAIFFGKPIWYSLLIAFARTRFAVLRPHEPPPGSASAASRPTHRAEWTKIAAGGIGRACLGWTFLLLRQPFLPGNYERTDWWRPGNWNDMIFLWMAVYGFVLWLIVAKAVFRQAPMKALVVFAAAAEALSLLVDIPIVHASRFNIC